MARCVSCTQKRLDVFKSHLPRMRLILIGLDFEDVERTFENGERRRLVHGVVFNQGSESTFSLQPPKDLVSEPFFDSILNGTGALTAVNLVNLENNSKRTWNFFIGKPVLVPGGYFPDDLDTTSLALMVLRPPSGMVTSVLNEMEEYVNSDGTFQQSRSEKIAQAYENLQTYFDRKKPRTDAVVSANVLACFYSFGRGHQLGRTLQLIHSVLLHRTYIHGTRYYPSPDCCLFFFGRLLQSSNDVHLHQTLGSLLKERTQERVGQGGSALDLAMRILVCSSLNLNCDFDRCALLDWQCEDGGWKAGWMYRYGSTGVRFGNRGVTTAMAVKAIACSENFSV